MFGEIVMREEKQRFRQEQRARRRHLSSDYWQQVGHGITDRLCVLLSDQRVNQVGLYWPLADEPVIGELPCSLAFPRVEGQCMRFLQCEASALRPGTFGIEEPPAECEEVIPEVLIVPGLAFAQDGSRLGRGKGFYDRYLTAQEPWKIGVIDEAGLVASLPVEAHDARMDVIITQERVLMRKDDRR
ncbi:MAG: 5-formyltetrahydrofolate cyclo-ligase [Myxococcales bacterium]|jgi:5-formyltetrahydrofolate cyclo-ligase|nr:5-formyltetrahydrofolate cyclo-ligase [Myxococcales bacterium]